jgi:hypothetical protein
MARKVERITARQLYIEENKSIEDIKKLMPDVAESTLYRWCTDENWDQQREEISTTSFGALKQSMIIANKQLQQMAASGKIDPAVLDAVSKLAKFAERMDKNVNAYGNILLAMQEFTEFLSDREPELLKKLEPFLIEFGSTMSKKYSKRH